MSKILKTTVQQQLNPQNARFGVKCKVDGPYTFFTYEKVEYVTLTGAWLILPDVWKFCSTMVKKTFFQQGDATAHTTQEILKRPHDIFGNQIISCGCEINWSPAHQIIAVQLFFPLGLPQKAVFENNPATINFLNKWLGK